jgi:hypothetical protein
VIKEFIHLEPVWGDRVNFVIAADVSDGAGFREWEKLFVEQVSIVEFVICCIPFFTYGIALGDRVRTSADYNFERVVEKSGHSVSRFWFGASDEAAGRDVFEWITARGCLVEWRSVNLLVADVRTDEELTEVEAFADAMKARGVEYERG